MLVPRLVVAVIVVLGSAACSSPSGSSAASSPSTASSAPSVTASPSTSPAVSPSIAALDESVLAPIPGLEYKAAQGSPSDADQARTFLQSAADPEAAATLIGGFLTRTLTYQDKLVGGVEVLRLTQTLSANEQDDVLRTLLGEFSQGTPTSDKVSGVRVWQVDAARGTKVGAVAWLNGNDVVITWSSGVADARKLSAAYIKAS